MIGSYTYTFTGSVTSSTSASGTYTGGSGTCADSGNFQANQASSFNGNYTGELTYSDGSKVNVTMAITEGGSPGFGVTANGTVTNVSGATALRRPAPYS